MVQGGPSKGGSVHITTPETKEGPESEDNSVVVLPGSHAGMRC